MSSSPSTTAPIHRVREGAADLFALAPDGARFPLLRVEAGAIFHANDGIVAVPTLGARLEPTSREAIGENEWRNWQDALETVLNGVSLEKWIENQADNAQQRLQSRAGLETQAHGQGWNRLWRVLESPRAPSPRKSTENPFLEAARAVFEASGIEFEAPPSLHISPDFADENAALEAIKLLGNASRVRFREVFLDSHWWREDAGAMLGFARQSEDSPGLRPVAFLPSGSEKMRIFDPQGDLDGTLVTARNAAQFWPRATVWTRPFPNRALKSLDILRFGARGLQAEIGWILGFSILGGLLGLLPPLITAQVFDSVLPGAESARLWPLVALLGVFALACAALSAVRGIAITRVESRLDASLQSALWDRLMRLSPDFFRDFTAGDLASRALAIGGVRQLLAGAVVSSLLGGIFSIFNWILLFSFDARLALIASGVMLVAGGVSLASGALQLRHEREETRCAGALSGLTLQLLQGAGALQVGGATGRAFGVWAKDFAARKAAATRARKVQNGAATFDAALPLLASMALFGAVAASQNRLSTGQFLAFSVAFGTLLASFLEVGRGLLLMLGIVPLLESARPILQATPENAVGAQNPGVLGGAIEISGLSFRYGKDGPLITDEVSLSIAPGEFVAFVGPSGSGKSTLLRLILGFETPESGGVYFDGRDLSALDLDAVRRQLGVVLQNGRLLPGSIFQNIAGASNLALADAWQAAARAGLASDIEAMPMGMHTVVGEGGSFSGGQKQRLLIARALASNPKILLFDEATSALDNLRQAQVSESLERLDATRIVVAHRLSTVRHADKIFVLVAGKLVESGNYDELMERNGAFADLVRRQMA